MALALDATSSYISDTWGSGNRSLSHTCSGANRVLIVSVVTIKNTGTIALTGVTYNGVSMTSIGSANVASGDGIAYMYGLKNPASGTNTILATTTGTGQLLMGGISFTGADQTTGWGTGQTATGNSTTPTVNVTLASGEYAVDCLAVNPNSTTTPSVGAGQTAIFATRYSDTFSNPIEGGASYESGSGSTTMSWTTQNYNWAMVAVNVKVALESSGNFLLLF